MPEWLGTLENASLLEEVFYLESKGIVLPSEY